MAEEGKAEQPIIIKKIVKGGGHHGGAWKVAYADFVTAMMAFFLLLWLLNVVTDEKKEALSNYFDPSSTKVSENTSGAGGVMGGLTMSPQGAMVSTVQPISAPARTGTAVNNNSARKSPDGVNKSSKKELKKEAVKEALRKAEQEKFEDAKARIEDAIAKDPDLKDLLKNLIIDMTPEGLRIQIVDEKGRPMFASGSARMLDITKQLVDKVGNVIQELPNEISIKGHTDSSPYGAGATYTNWELSADRANAARRQLSASGINPEKINNIAGKADTELLLPEDPNNARNRRISITLLKEELTNPEGFDKKAEELAAELPDTSDDPDGEYDGETTPPIQVPIGTFRRTPGAVEFP